MIRKRRVNESKHSTFFNSLIKDIMVYLNGRYGRWNIIEDNDYFIVIEHAKGAKFKLWDDVNRGSLDVYSPDGKKQVAFLFDSNDDAESIARTMTRYI